MSWNVFKATHLTCSIEPGTLVQPTPLVLLTTCALISSGCATTPSPKKPAANAEKTASWSKDDFDIFVEINADRVLVNGTEVATHDGEQFDPSVPRKHHGLLVVPISRSVDAAEDAAPHPSLAIAANPVVSAQILTAVVYSAPGSLSENPAYTLIVGDGPPTVVELPEFSRLMQEENLAAPPMLTLSPTWQTMRLAAFMKLAKLGDCVADGSCAAHEKNRRRWASEARTSARANEPQRAQTHLRKLASSYDLQQAHKLLGQAVSRAREINGHPPRYLKVNMKGELPVSLYPELFALRCANWSPGLAEEAATAGEWTCEAMVDTIVVNIVR